MELHNKFADYFNPANGEDVPRDLIGATIIAIGAPVENKEYEGGGLIIKYSPKDSNVIKVLGLSFNDLGMWIQNQM